jgi:hypothetical protein
LCKDGYYVNSGGGCTASKVSFFTKTIIYKVTSEHWSLDCPVIQTAFSMTSTIKCKD